MARTQRADLSSRADAILDTAKDLLLRWGYRRVTIDEIARRAGVGKGTVYLHWRTREELFLAVGAREAAEMIGAVIVAIRSDPSEMALHRYMRRFFVEAMSRPVLRAIFTRDAATLGKLVSDPARQPLQVAKLGASHAYLGLLIDNGLLRGDLKPADMDYSLPTLVFGFFAMEPLLPSDSVLSLPDKADQLADALLRIFGPAGEVAEHRYRDIAPEVIEIFVRLSGEYRKTAYGAAPPARSSPTHLRKS